MMYVLLKRINQMLEARTLELLKDRFDVPEHKAEFVLPIVSAFLLIQMKKCLETGSANYDAVPQLERLLMEGIKQQATYGAGEVEELKAVCRAILGNRNDVVACALASILGVEEQIGADLRDCIQPMVLAYLCRCLIEWEGLSTNWSFFHPSHVDRMDLLRYILSPESQLFGIPGTIVPAG